LRGLKIHKKASKKGEDKDKGKKKPKKRAKEELEKGEVGRYGSMKSKDVAGPGLERDHIPPKAAVKKMIERELDRPLTAKEKKALERNLTAVAIPKEIHEDGRTHSQTEAAAEKDSKNLRKAQDDDLKEHREKLKKDGMIDSQVDDMEAKTRQRNNELGIHDDPPSEDVTMAAKRTSNVTKAPATHLKVKELETLLKKPHSSPEAQAIVAKIAGRSKRYKDGTAVHYTYRDAGLELIVKLDRVTTAFLQTKSKDNEEYGGELPEGIAFSMKPKDLSDALGEPDKGDETSYLYERGLYRLHVEFDDEVMTMVTLSTNTPS